MITLIQVVNPKTFVELGTHNGCSFFAACQGAELRGETDDLNFLAIDSWEGDAHSGKHKPSVLKRFEYYIEKYFPWAGYRRDFFENVAPDFENDSIDLLHIDGLHTYEAVKNDFETWSPKVRDGGIILFHDTHEKAGDFGVWKLWEELKTQYTTIDFPHYHGLGVLCKGTPTEAVSELFEKMQSPHVNYSEVFEQAAHLQIEAKVHDFLTESFSFKPRRLLKYIERIPVILKR